MKTMIKHSVLGLLLSTALAPAASAETFQEVLISVYNSNPRILAERARVREIDENYVQARAQGRFTMDASGSYGLTTARSVSPGSIFNPGPTNVYSNGYPANGQLQIIQPLYQGGRVKALKRQANSGIMAAREGLRNAEQSIFLAAANAFIDVKRGEEAAKIRRNNVSVLARQELAANDRFNVGEGTRTDIAQAQSRMAAAESGLAQAEAELQVSRATFRRIVGHPPVDLQTVPLIELPRTLAQAIALARENNPQLLAAYYNEQAGEAAIDVAKSASRPVISLNGTASGTRNTVLGISEADQLAILAQIRVPIMAGGSNKSRVRQAKHAKTRLAFEARDTELAVDQTVSQIWAQLEAARLSLKASQNQVKAAETAFEGVDLEQKVGTRTTLDVLDAEQELLNAKLAVIDAQRAVDAASFQLLVTIGVFDTVGLQLPVEAYDPSKNLDAIKYDGLVGAVDKYVPEVLQDAKDIVPDFVEDAVREIKEVPDDFIDAAERLAAPIVSPLPDTADERLIDAGKSVPELPKRAVDRITLQEPEYDPLIGQELPAIDTESKTEPPIIPEESDFSRNSPQN